MACYRVCEKVEYMVEAASEEEAVKAIEDNPERDEFCVAVTDRWAEPADVQVAS